MMRTQDDLPRNLRQTLFLGSVLLSQLIGAGCQRNVSGDAAQTIIAMEQSALERWGKGDPNGYFEIMAPDTTYFDPTLAKRIDGVDALHALIDPFKGKIHIERAEMIDAKVQQQGDIAVLTFNLVSHGAQLGDGPKGDVRWNSTEVYQRISGQWKIIHSHWSYTKPELKEKPAE
jgi:ketosteroid isomerase-like protein